MELFMIKARFGHYGSAVNASRSTTTPAATVARDLGDVLVLSRQLNATVSSAADTMSAADEDALADNYTAYPGDLLADNTSALLWNNTALFNLTNSSDYNVDYDYQTLNGSAAGADEAWSFCNEWTAAQHNLFQTANLFFAAAFLVPMSFKQSVLLVRALLTLGYLFATFWAGSEVCALDILLWNTTLVLINLVHTLLLTWKFLPPTLTLDLTDLYLKVFKPLRVSKKHFKELVSEAKVVALGRGDIYAVEDVSPADERLSILLKGKLRVTCDDTHLHFISAHQFVDSPEWEANHEQSDDVFQVTITAEEDCVYLCWPRMKLERVLRHRPMLKTVLDSIIGKDITQKLYSLNEHLGDESPYDDDKDSNELRNLQARSLSLDAVNTGTTGRVRSIFFKANQRKPSFSSSGYGSPARAHNQCWVPLVANHFPAESPFMPRHESMSMTSYLLPEPEYSPLSTRTARQQKTKEVTFVNEVETVPHQNRVK